MLQGLGGVIASIASIITISLSAGPVETGFCYFLIGLVAVFASLLIFFALVRLVSERCIFCLLYQLTVVDFGLNKKRFALNIRQH